MNLLGLTAETRALLEADFFKHFFISSFIYFFRHKNSCFPGWPRTFYIIKNDL